MNTYSWVILYRELHVPLNNNSFFLMHLRIKTTLIIFIRHLQQ